MELYRKLVWLDYRLAIFLLVSVPLVLLLWSTIRGEDAMQRLLIIYWRVASLLAITVYLMIGALPVAYWVGAIARGLIPLGLWFWLDLNEEITDHRPTSLKLALTSWRWGATVYCGLGLLWQIPSLRCSLMNQDAILTDTACRVWLDAPWGFRAMVHANYTPGFLGFLGITGLLIYSLYLGYFVLVRLGRQGRSAMPQ